MWILYIVLGIAVGVLTYQTIQFLRELMRD